VKQSGRAQTRDLWAAYAKHVRSFLEWPAVAKLKIVIDASNGMAGTMIPKLFGKAGVVPMVPGLQIIEVNFDNTRGIFAHEPNPLVESNLKQVQEAVLTEAADLGVCFDGDADRCVIIDEKGKTVGCDHLTALLARKFLATAPGAAIVYDLRSTKAVAEEVTKAGGKPVRGRVGHVFLKQAMADNAGIFGGELSGHFYFKDNYNADSGVISLCVVLSIMAKAGVPMSELIAPIARYPQSGEMNFAIDDKDGALLAITKEFMPPAKGAQIDELDGVTIDCFAKHGWWCNIRKSNTEPLLRLNMEAKDRATLDRVLLEISPKLGRRVDH